VVAQVEREAAPKSKVVFNPDRLAYLEVAGWRAYYDHKWFRFLQLMLLNVREQTGLSWPRAIQAAYYFTQASMAWSPVDNDPPKVKLYLRKFYRLVVEKGNRLKFDPDKVAEAEYVYWDVHRRLSGKPESEKEPLIRSLAELHSGTFGIPLDEAWESGVQRAHSTDTVDLITGKRSKDVEGDWRKSEDYLREAYRDIAQRL
jgi:hypothetical protein